MKIKEVILEKNVISLMIFGISLVILHFLYLPLVDAFPLLIIFIVMCEIAYLIVSVIYFIYCLKRNIITSGVISVICIVTVLISIQMIGYWEDLNFTLLLSKREEVISLIKNGSLGKGTQEETLKLPRKYRSVSKEGTISINRNDGDLFVTFDTYKTWLDNFEGFVYCSNNKEPSADLLFYKGATVIFTRKQNNWFLFEHL